MTGFVTHYLRADYNNVILSISDDTRRVDDTQKVLITATVSLSSSSDATQQDIDNVLEASFTSNEGVNYVDLLRDSTDSILSSAIDVVYIFDASMYPSQVPLSITLAPDTIKPTISTYNLPCWGL